MSPDTARWRQADALLGEALDLAPEHRGVFLDGACGDDAELRALLARLLADAEEGEGGEGGEGGGPRTEGRQIGSTGGGASEDREVRQDRGDFLTPGGGLVGPLLEALGEEMAGLPATALPAAGDTVGRYRLLREIGRGGMAVVFLAERADGEFQQQVAVKLIQPGIAGPAVLARFERERQILALARHPAIARLLDGGTTDDGRPYFVMEHVDGRPIDVYADEERLTLRERLRLFLRVARGVDDAHRNLVVHRDLKPSNILVTADGEPKLLDFGIARLLREGSDDLTRTREQMMTPAWASPEQVRGERVAAASDVYQLGLLLYLLLTGRWPYSGADDPVHLVRAILGEEPTRPSAAVARAARGAEDGGPGGRLGSGGSEGDGGAARGGAGCSTTNDPIGHRRRSTSRRLSRELGGDLDNILLKALRKEPERRYASVAHLADDVERYLDGRPVSARPDRLLYRASKLLRRHKAAAAAAAAGLVLLLGFAGYHAGRLARERDRAERAAAEAQEVSRFLTGLFEVSAPTRARGEAITAREVLDRGAERIRRDLADEPRLGAALMTVMGDVYRELALYPEAAELLERAVELRRTERRGRGGRRSDRDLELAQSLFSLGRLRLETADLEGAEAAFAESLALRTGALGEEAPEVADALAGRGRVAAAMGRYEAAEGLLRQALEIEQGTPHPDPARAGAVLLDLAACVHAARRFEEARELYEGARRRLEEAHGALHPRVVLATVDLAGAVADLGEWESARRLYREALPRVEAAFGAVHPLYAATLADLAVVLRREGLPADARKLLERALDVRLEALGPDHPDVAATYLALGMTWKAQGRPADALPWFQRAAEGLERTLGPDHPDLDTVLGRLAEAHLHAGDAAAAVPLYQRAILLRTRHFGADAPALIEPLQELGEAKLALGDVSGAEAPLRRAVELGDRVADELGHAVVLPRVALARCLAAQGRQIEAETALRTAEEQSRGGHALVRRLVLEALLEQAASVGSPLATGAAAWETELAALRAAAEATGPKAGGGL